MDINKTQEQEAVTETPEVVVADPTPVVDSTPVVETPTEAPAPLPQGDCTECTGTGLIGDPSGQNALCTQCSGTGKVA